MSTQELIEYINIGVIVFVGVFALIGFMRGTYKSLFYLIATVIVFVGGWLLMGTFINLISNYNLETYNINYEGIALNSINQFIPDYITHAYPNVASLFENDTLVKELIFSLTNMALKLIYLIIIGVLSFTIFKLLTDILWLIFKPKKKKGQRRKKKTFLSRFGGAGIGTLKGAFYLMLLLFPLAGIVSITQSLAVRDDLSGELRYNLVFIDDTVTLVESENNPTSVTADLDEFFKYVGVYQKSFAGKFFGAIPADEFVFDSIFSFKINNNDIKLRKELTTIASAFAKSKHLIEGEGFSTNKLLQEDPDVLKEIIDDISSLELVKVVIPMGIEVALYVKDDNGNPILQLPEGLEIDINEVKSIDFASDVKKLGYAFVDITTIYPFGSDNTEINYLDFDPDTVKKIMDNIGSTDIVDKFAPIAISYVVTLDSINDSLQTLNLTIEDLGITEIEDWGAELSQFGNIYEAIANLQIKKLDNTETFEFVTEDKITALSNAMFESVLISKASPVLVKMASDSFMPKEFTGVINIDTNLIDANEFSAVLNATIALIKSDLLSGDENAFKDLTSELTNDLAKYLSKSKLITSNLNAILDVMVNNLNLFDEKIEFVTLTNEEWNQKELSSIFNSFRVILIEGIDNLITLEDNRISELSSYLANSKFITRNFNVIADKALAQLNLGEDIKIGRFDNWENVDAGERELFHLFKSAKIIQEKGSDAEALLSLGQTELDTILGSQILSETLVNVLKAYSEPGKQLEFLVGVNDENVDWYDKDFTDTTFMLNDREIIINPVEGATKYNIYGDGILLVSTRKLTYTITLEPMPNEIKVEAFKEGEIRKMFSVIGSLMDSLTGDEGFSIDVITKLTNDDIENITVSDILVLSIVKKLEDMAIEDPNFVVVIPDGDLKSLDKTVKLGVWKGSNKVEGELSKAIKGLKLLLSETDLTNFKPEDITNISDDNIYEILKSDVLCESIIVQIEKQSDDPDSPVVIPDNHGLGKNDSRDAWKNIYQYDNDNYLINIIDGELTRTLRALRIVLDGQDFNNIDVNKILKKDVRETVLESIIIEATIINVVEEEAAKQDSIIAIPKRLKNNPLLWYKNPEHGEGELRKLLNALDFIMNENDSITNIDLDFSTIVENKDEILKSEVLIESVVIKITKQEEINIPLGMGLNDEEDRSTWSNVYILDNEYNYTYDGEGKVKISSYGEVSHLLDAADIVIEADPVTGKKSFDNIDFKIDSAFDKTKQDIILRSLVVSETIVHKIYEEADKPESIIKIPQSNAYVNQLHEPSRSAWFNTYNNDGSVKTKGEIAHLLDAADLLLDDGVEFENIDIDLSNIFINNNKDIILKSYVISETIVHKIYNENKSGVMEIPSSYYLNPIYNEFDNGERDKWYNAYNLDGDVNNYGEISYLLDAADQVIEVDPLTGKKKLDNIDFKVDVAFDQVKQPIILRSLVISETIVNKIFEEAEKENAILKIPANEVYVNGKNDPRPNNRDLWFTEYNIDGTVKKKGEIVRLLNAADLLLSENDSFDNINFDLSAAFVKEKQLDILKSKVISETIVHKIYEEANNNSILKIPTSDYYVNKLSDINRNLWFNEYNDENIFYEGEIAHLLDAADLLLAEESSFDNINFDLSAAFNQQDQDIILLSKVISETIVNKVFQESIAGNIYIPISDEYVNSQDDPRSENRDLWYNEYHSDGTVKKSGEIACLLNAVNLLTNGGNFSGMDFDLSGAFDEIKQPIILKSYVISETIVKKVFEESQNSEIIIPKAKYVNPENDPNRNLWFNIYNSDGTINEKGEIAHLLDAVNLLTGGEDFSGMTFDLSNAFDSEKQLTILKSKVISESIVNKVFVESDSIQGEIAIPSDIYVNSRFDENRDLWYNIYNKNETLNTKGEIAYLIDAVNALTNGGVFSGMTFDLSNAFDELKQPIILHSKVISESIVNKVFKESETGLTIKIPSENYVNTVDDPNRNLWFNDYNEDELLYKGEIAYLLDAVNELMDGGAFAGMSFDLSKAFDPESQNLILKSTVISETIVNKIYEETGNGVLVMPDKKYVNEMADNNREKWFNDYNIVGITKHEVDKCGEIAKLLNASKLLLAPNQDFANITFDIDALFNKQLQREILKSYVFSESIIKKIIDNTEVIENTPDVDLIGRPLNLKEERSAWYNEYNNNLLKEENELAKFLDSIKLIVGSTKFDEMEKITIDYILDIEFNIEVSNEKIITNSDIIMLLDSVIVEHIISPLVSAIASNEMESFLNIPEGGYNFYKTGLITDYDLTTYDPTKYDTQSFLESIYLMNKAGFKYNELDNIDFSEMTDAQMQGLSEAMVVSRVFKGSIAKMFNNILYPIYDMAPSIPANPKKPWDDIKFIQSEYDGTNLSAYNNLYNKLVELKGIPTLFYDI